MIEWTPKRRENAGKLLLNASTILLGTLVLGNFVAGKPFNIWTFAIGVFLYAAAAITVIILEK
jgi:hypothetical protein